MNREEIKKLIDKYRLQENQALAMANRSAGAVVALEEVLASLPETESQPPNDEG